MGWNILVVGANWTTLQEAMIPMFPITINGNRFDESVKPAANASKTDYILVQSRGRLSPSKRQKLGDAGLKHIDYVSKNTCLCHYQSADLDKVRQMEPIVHTDVYRLEFKMAPNLKEAVPDRDYKVDVIFHRGVQSDSTDFRDRILETTRSGKKYIEFFPHKVRLFILGQCMHDTAMLDDVRCIEKIGKLVSCNDQARLIMGADNYPGLWSGARINL